MVAQNAMRSFEMKKVILCTLLKERSFKLINITITCNLRRFKTYLVQYEVKKKLIYVMDFKNFNYSKKNLMDTIPDVIIFWCSLQIQSQPPRKCLPDMRGGLK